MTKVGWILGIVTLALGANLLLGNYAPVSGSETINFVWEKKGSDIPGSLEAYGKNRVDYMVQKGKGTVTIVRSGMKKADATIVVSAHPTKSAQIAVAELNHYLEKITGARAKVVTDDSNPFEGPKILVGESKLTRALGLKNGDFAEQEYAIATYDDMLVLMGYDEPEYGLIDYEGNGLWDGFALQQWSLKPEWSKKVGSVYAVHTFLQKFCGIRWYLPGELGEVCPKKESITFKDVDLRLKPWSQYRQIYPYAFLDYFNFVGSEKKRVPMNARDLNLWELRMKLVGCEAFNANHSLIVEWFKPRFPDKKDILAQGYEHPSQLCLTSPELLKIVVQDANDYFTGKTNHERSSGDYFCVMPYDTDEYCKCPQCQTLIKSVAETKGYDFWTDRTSNYAWNLVNEVAKKVKKRNPDKWVNCCSYARYALVPDKVELSDNIAVEVCRVLTEGIKDPGYKRFYSQEIKDWAKTVRRWYLWEYFDHIQGNYSGNSFPGIFLREIAEDIRFLKENECRGIFNELSCYEGYLPNIAQDHLNLYVQLQLLNDATSDVDEILDEYCRLFYGPACEPMKKFFVKMEERFSNKENWKLEGDQIDANWDKICPLSELKKFKELINSASLLAEDEPYRTRVRLFKEAVYGMMEKNCIKHFVFMKSAKRRLIVPFLRDEKNLLKTDSNHVGNFYSLGGDPVISRTEAWVGYDNENIYVRVKCYEEQMDKIKAVIKPEDKEKMYICEDDCVELFIDVGRTRKNFYHILGNTNGAIAEQTLLDGKKSTFGNWTGASSRIEKGKDSWTITFTVPLKNLTKGGSVEKGTAWGLNICRDREVRSKSLEGKEMWTCWCPTDSGTWHKPEGYGVLEFGE
ncbi:MAG: DUF4838 domain-containing protein [Candidatus Zixiibacteriota bacterium]